MLNRKGFTLIELLIVVVIIGILAAIAIPKFASTKEKAYVASMKSDLRNLATAQEAYFADFGLYAAVAASNLAAGAPVPDPATGFVPSANVTINGAIVAGGAGWNATTVHASAPGRTCEIFIAGAQVAGPGGLTQVEGEPGCN
jgi:prepilin-type N-terminal cleavage/methylation domain-containing protein